MATRQQEKAKISDLDEQVQLATSKYNGYDVEGVLKTILKCFINNKIDLNSWVYNFMLSTIKKLEGKKLQKKKYSDIEIITANFIRSLYGNSVSMFLQLNTSFPSRVTTERRMKEIRRGILKTNNRFKNRF